MGSCNLWEVATVATIDVRVVHLDDCHTALRRRAEAAAVCCCCIAESSSLAMLDLDEGVSCCCGISGEHCSGLAVLLAAEVCCCCCCTVEEEDLAAVDSEGWQMSTRQSGRYLHASIDDT